MMNISYRIVYNPFRNLNPGFYSFGYNNFGSQRRYSKDKGKCCKDVAQTEGRRIEPWPKSDPPPPNWHGCCPREPQPPNYDPYRIKVPDVVVPPLPPSNAKEFLSGDKFKDDHTFGKSFGIKDLFFDSPIVHPNYWQDRPNKKLVNTDQKYDLPKLGYHGRDKYKYAFHEPWKPLDRLSLLERAERGDGGQPDVENTPKEIAS